MPTRQLAAAPRAGSASSAPTNRVGHRDVPVWVSLLALALGGFAIGTTEFASMGVLPEIARRPARVDPDRRARHHGVRAGCGRGGTDLRDPRCPAAPQGAAARPDGRTDGGEPGVVAGADLRHVRAGAVRQRVPARRLLRHRRRGGVVAGAAGAPGPRRRHDDDGPDRGQRRRRPAHDSARAGGRLAQHLPDRGRHRCPDAGGGAAVRAAGRGARGREPAAGAVRAAAPAGVADPAGRGGRLRRLLRGLQLHRADPHRGVRASPRAACRSPSPCSESG